MRKMKIIISFSASIIKYNEVLAYSIVRFLNFVESPKIEEIIAYYI
jgi:hypothetical protein